MLVIVGKKKLSDHVDCLSAPINEQQGAVMTGLEGTDLQSKAWFYNAQTHGEPAKSMLQENYSLQEKYLIIRLEDNLDSKEQCRIRQECDINTVWNFWQRKLKPMVF